MRQATQYFYRNGLLLNTNKTKCMFIGSRGLISQIPSTLHMNVGGSQISPCNSLNILGVHFDTYMQFDTHINEICKKTYGTILYINRIKKNFDMETRINVMMSLVLSVINYGIRIWGSTYKTQIHRVQKLQNFAAKVAVGGATKQDHVTPYLKDLNWLKIKEKYKLEIGALTYSIVRECLPAWLFTLPTLNNIRGHPRETRQNESLYVPKHNTCFGARALQVEAPIFWNSLPSYVKQASSLPCFKERLKSYLLQSQF